MASVYNEYALKSQYDTSIYLQVTSVQFCLPLVLRACFVPTLATLPGPAGTQGVGFWTPGAGRAVCSRWPGQGSEPNEPRVINRIACIVYSSIIDLFYFHISRLICLVILLYLCLLFPLIIFPFNL
jgi:hypothetical protein